MEERKSFQTGRWQILCPFLVIAAAIMSYANSFFLPFIFDDEAIIVTYPNIHRLGAIAWDSRFIVNLTFRLNYAMGKLNVVHYHVTNLFVHMGAGLLLYGVIRRALLLPRLRYRYAAIAPMFAAFCAAIWVAHPLQTESVTYICQRYESMMGLLFLLAVYSFIRGLESPFKRLWHDACIAACIVGMATKETMVAAPPLILLFDYLMSSDNLVSIVRRQWKFYVALLGTLVILAMLELKMTASIVRVGANTHTQAAGGPGAAGSAPHLPYFATQFIVITHYLRLLVFPHPLCLDYGWPPARSIGAVLLPGIFIMSLVFLTMLAIWKKSPAGFLGAWFFATLAPSSSIIPLSDLAFEHRMYLPSAAVIVLIAAVVCRAMDLLENRFAVSHKAVSALLIALGIMCVSCCVAVTSIRNTDYTSEEIMWRDVVEKRPENLRARNNLAVVLCETEKPAKITEAMVHYLYVLGQTEGKVPRITKPRAMADNSLENNRFRALVNMGLLASRQGRYDESANKYTEAMRIFPYTFYLPGRLRKALLRSGIPEDKVDEEIARRLSEE